MKGPDESGPLFCYAHLVIVGLDPGKNVGVAFVHHDELVYRAVITLEALRTLRLPRGATLVIGNGTGAEAVKEVLRARALSFAVLDEMGTTLEARALYFKDHPPRGLLRLLPKGLRSPPKLIDDYAAYAIVLRYLKENGQEKEPD